MGGASRDLVFAGSGPTVILMSGLQGSGKTTACAKLAKHLGDQGKSVGLAACDTQRPAAVEQLVTMGKRSGATVFEQGTERDPVEIAEWALGQARSQGLDVLIVDTAGRLHVDEELMSELVRIRKATKPHNVLLVARLDDRPGRGQRRRGVQRAGRLRRRRPDEARRRRPRRRRALGHARSPASRSCTPRTASGSSSSSASTPSGWRAGSSAWATSSR